MKRLLTGKMLLLAALIILCVAVGVAAAESVTIVGEVTDDYQIVTSDGQIYDVADTETGVELLDTMISEKVKVKGIVHEEGETKTIEVTSFEVVTE